MTDRDRLETWFIRPEKDIRPFAFYRPFPSDRIRRPAARDRGGDIGMLSRGEHAPFGHDRDIQPGSGGRTLRRLNRRRRLSDPFMCDLKGLLGHFALAIAEPLSLKHLLRHIGNGLIAEAGTRLVDRI